MSRDEQGQHPLSEREMAERRLSLLDAYLVAVERKEEVMGIVADAEDPESAGRAVADLLLVTETNAAGVLDLRLTRFTQREVVSLQRERDSIVAHLETLKRSQ
jgi:DNA gyrase/topoisomerase IV subunit A